MKNAFIGLTVAVAILLGSTGINAQNLIVNGGFENGSTGWVNNNGVAGSGFNGIPAHGGSFFLSFGAVGGDATTSQTVATALGGTYDLQFFYWMDGGTPGDFNVLWNGVNIYSEPSISTPHPWVQHDFLVIGTGSDTVTFGGRDDPTWNGLDDVSLFAVGVPEPATWGLLAFVGVLLGYYTWNRRRVMRSSLEAGIRRVG